MAEERRWTNEKMDWIISGILRVGVAAAALVVFAGGVYYLVRHGAEPANYRVFVGEPRQLRSIFGVVGFALSSHSRGVIELGLLILIATPIARVVFSVIAFARQRDWTYVVVTLIVLGVLVYNLTGAYQ